jgi:hypothetical protein
MDRRQFLSNILTAGSVLALGAGISASGARAAERGARTDANVNGDLPAEDAVETHGRHRRWRRGHRHRGRRYRDRRWHRRRRRRYRRCWWSRNRWGRPVRRCRWVWGWR